ncbi:S24 family peptidase [Roseibium polysiphoniae]|uniref:Helix-turn-helix transcriptional regulator n=1 Tax=Roseibium polysiphoniae TaxID=2571221 RepID=A0ABR9CD78_9HYPH|nr:helix-turn-helix transcriptional regulator [Roseibium polysiphoniae]MBD8877833.1 helix-turn-helix transcriptional regulator [Roseibium polysiphoniae]
MLSHAQVWAAIDGLARRNGLSPSGLAKRAGLDPTTFNPSKRFAGDGRARWPSTESLAKILEATGEPLKLFVAEIQAPKTLESEGEPGRQLPLTGLAEASGEGSFDDQGAPQGKSWAQMAFPDPKAKGLFALEVSGDAMLPLYRDGDIIIVAPEMALRKGDRVVVKQRRQSLSVLMLQQRTETAMEFRPLDQSLPSIRMEHGDIDWVGRIIWASQ